MTVLITTMKNSVQIKFRKNTKNKNQNAKKKIKIFKGKLKNIRKTDMIKKATWK